MTPVNEVLSRINLPFKLHKYQRDDINRLAPKKSCGFYLFMGSGKTIMGVITGIYKLLHGYNTVVVLVPASVQSQWFELLTSLGVKVCNYKGTPTERKKLDLDADFLLMSYQIYQKDYERLKEIKKPYFVVDEATVLCNPQNLLYKMLNGGVNSTKVKGAVSDIVDFINKINSRLRKAGAKGVAGRMSYTKRTQYIRVADGMCLLTGTPINKPNDAYGLINITSPDTYSSYYMFELTHVDKVDNFGNPVTYKNLELLNKNLCKNAIVREVSDHLDLPEKVYNVVQYDLSPAHLKLYKKVLTEEMIIIDDKIVVDALEANKLYHLAQELVLCPEIAGYESDPAGLELLDTIVGGVKQAIIFNHHTSINSKIMKRYECGGCFGDVSRPNQTQFVEKFKDGKLKILVANAKSAGVGLNLQICNQVVFSELPITSRDLRQAEARCWRQGQKERVIVTLLVARNTIQQTLLKRILERDEVSKQVLRSKKSLREDFFC